LVIFVVTIIAFSKITNLKERSHMEDLGADENGSRNKRVGKCGLDSCG
jgi:hypothetical protein